MWTGLVHATRAVVEGMKARGFGRIVNLTSVAAHGTAISGTTFYAATKSAVIALTRRFALQLGPYGITVNAVAPGFILTNMATGDGNPAEAQATIDAMAARAMVRRTGLPEDSPTRWHSWSLPTRVSSPPKPLRWTRGGRTTSRIPEPALNHMK
jgi:3-oxoacyl-[acyl-carrier protein] reductase